MTSPGDVPRLPPGTPRSQYLWQRDDGHRHAWIIEDTGLMNPLYLQLVAWIAFGVLFPVKVLGLALVGLGWFFTPRRAGWRLEASPEGIRTWPVYFHHKDAQSGNLEPERTGGPYLFGLGAREPHAPIPWERIAEIRGSKTAIHLVLTDGEAVTVGTTKSENLDGFNEALRLEEILNRHRDSFVRSAADDDAARQAVQGLAQPESDGRAPRA